MSDYQLDNRWPLAHRRLSLLCEAGDPQSFDALRATGITRGWRCLEVGAGLGTVARWMATAVGPEGHVTATDIETHFLDQQGLDRQEDVCFSVLRHDIDSDPVGEEAYDLVHVRAVLMHLPSPPRVLKKLIASLRPGGWLVVEEPDFQVDGPDELGVSFEDRALYTRVKDQVLGALRDRGLHFSLGRSLWGSLRRLELESIFGFGRTQLVVGGSAQSEFESLTYGQLLPSIPGATAVDRERFLALFDDPNFAYFREMLVTVAGRKPLRTA